MTHFLTLLSTLLLRTCFAGYMMAAGVIIHWVLEQCVGDAGLPRSITTASVTCVLVLVFVLPMSLLRTMGALVVV